jgi:capsular exopolysaccharide synthesis family protein
MGKIHKALERAEKEVKEKRSQILGDSLPVGVEPSKKWPIKMVPNQYDEMRAKLLSLYAKDVIKTILFAATSHGGGCSTTAMGLAASLAENSRLKVIVVDVNLRTPKLHEQFNIEKIHSLSDLSQASSKDESRIRHVGFGNLYVTTCFGYASGLMSLFESSQFEDFLETIGKQFDYVVLDAPPMPGSLEAKILSAKVDGVILVIEAGKTRRQIALKAIKEVEQAGGKLLGVVLNKREHHIPKWIYKRL